MNGRMKTPEEKKPALVSEMTKQAGEIHDRWPWVEACVWTENMLKALENGVKGNKWFSLIDKVWKLDNLASAFAEVRANDGAPGVDHISIARFERDLDQQLLRLQAELQEGRYQPRPARRKWIDKPGSKVKRPLGIPTVRDRVVEAALRHVIEPIFEKEFADCSHGFRPGRSPKTALKQVDRLLKEGNQIVLEIDIRSYFDNIEHDRLLQLVGERISDGRVLTLIESMLKRGVQDGENQEVTERGTPQGGVISPLLANIYLNELDHLITGAGHHLVRYADDLLVLCEGEAQAQVCRQQIETWMQSAGLELHPEKTCVVDMSRPGAWFDYLGYRFKRSPRTGKLGRYASQKSQSRLRDRLRPYLKRCNGWSMEAIIAMLNPVLRGWYEYFKHTRRCCLESLDGWVRMRLRSILRKRCKGRRGRGRGADHRRWPNIYFAKLGLFTMATAQAEELQSSLR